MKKLMFVAFLLLVAGCTQPAQEESPSNLSFSFTPISNFTADDINYLGVNCSGNDSQIAECIYNWQLDNMIYAPTYGTNLGDIFGMRWQELIPGIYTSKDIIYNQVHDGKVYGVCFDFAAVYCSIARYYNLACRMVEAKTNLNNETRTGGMSEYEYNKLKPYLLRAGFNFSYDAIRLSMPNESEMPGHYWAEVKLDEASEFDDGGWRIMDASNKMYNGRSMTLKHLKEGGQHDVIDWSKKNRLSVIQSFEERAKSGEDFSSYNPGNLSQAESLIQAREHYEQDVMAGREKNYTGIVDDLGNEGRAKNIADFNQGKGLAPFYNECADVCSFFGNSLPNCMSECESEMSYFNCYESCSGRHFNKICEFVCGDSDEDWARCYELCSGDELDASCDSEC